MTWSSPSCRGSEGLHWTLEPSVVRLRRVTVIQERGVLATAVTLLLRGECAGWELFTEAGEGVFA